MPTCVRRSRTTLAEPDVDHGRPARLLSSAYLAAVYLAADARRKGDEEMAATFRVRALASGSVAGVAAIAGALVVRSDARWIFDRLVDTPAVLSVALSLLAGAATLVLVARWRLDAARVSAAIAVAAVVGGRPSRFAAKAIPSPSAGPTGSGEGPACRARNTRNPPFDR